MLNAALACAAPCTALVGGVCLQGVIYDQDSENVTAGKLVVLAVAVVGLAGIVAVWRGGLS